MNKGRSLRSSNVTLERARLLRHSREERPLDNSTLIMEESSSPSFLRKETFAQLAQQPHFSSFLRKQESGASQSKQSSSRRNALDSRFHGNDGCSASSSTNPELYNSLRKQESVAFHKRESSFASNALDSRFHGNDGWRAHFGLHTRLTQSSPSAAITVGVPIKL